MTSDGFHHDNELSGAGLAELTGRQIGRYLIGRRLGSGGVATVYQAYDQVQGQTVALKVLAPSADEKSYGRFRREALTAGALRHPHIVRILQVGSAPLGEIAYIAMELVEGESLADLLAVRRTLSLRDSCGLLAPIARALAFAHRAGVVHRDVKPSNILLRLAQPGAQHSIQTDALDHAVIPLLSDFGIARGLDTPELTSAGRTVGTPAYMAPEQCAGSRMIDGRADIYGLGAVLYRCVVGRLPFTGSTTQILHAHVYEPLTMDTDLVNRLPPLLVDVLRRSLAKSPDERYADADDMAAALEQVARDLLEEDSLSNDEDEQNATATLTQTLVVSPVERKEQPIIAVTVLAAAPRPPHPTGQIAVEPRAANRPTNAPFLAIGVTLIALLFIIGLWLGISVWRDRLGGVASTPVAAGVSAFPPAPTNTATPSAEPPTPTMALHAMDDQAAPGLYNTPTAVETQSAPPQPTNTTVATTVVSPEGAPVIAPPASPTPTATVTPETAPTVAPTATETPLFTPTPAPSPTPTPSPSPTPSPTPTTPAEEEVLACTNVTETAFIQFIAGLPADIRSGFLCPNAPPAATGGRLLSFQNGFMLQVGERPDVYIYYLTENQWERAASSWRPGDPPPAEGMESPGDGLYVPDSVFGSLWVEPRRQSALGYALAAESTTFRAIEQSFPGGVLIADLDGDAVHLFLMTNLRL